MADLKLHLGRTYWLTLLKELHDRGHDRHESGAFLLGHVDGDRRFAETVVFYDDLDRDAYASGVCILEGDSFEQLWSHCRTTGLSVIADIHTHGGRAVQSCEDRQNPMIARSGHLALIVPNFARDHVWRHHLGLYQYRGSHQWHDLSGWRSRTILKTGTWR